MAKKGPVKTGQQAAANWQQGMGRPSTAQNYKDGIARTNVNPMALAASPEATQKYLDAVQRSVTSGRRNNALMAANPATWKENASTVGAQRLSSGAQKALPKATAAFNRLSPIWQQMRDAANQIGGSGLAAAQAKSNAALALLMQAAGTA